MKNQYDNVETAVTYDRSVKIKQDGLERVAAMQLVPGMKVLDIGSGPGILALPLAKRGCQVTVVEPSEAMRSLLMQHMEEEGVNDIKILPYTWEEVPETELERYDLVIASYSLLMPDFKSAAIKMNHCSRGNVELYWFAGETSWERDGRILGKRLGRTGEVKRHRKIDEFYQILYNMGLYADITMLHGTSFDREYSCFEDAVRDMKKRYDITEEELPVLRTYLEERLVKRENTWYYRDLTHYVKLSWKAALRKEEESV